MNLTQVKSPAEKREIIRKVEEARKTAKSIKEAAAQVGTNFTTYYQFKKDIGQRPKYKKAAEIVVTKPKKKVKRREPQPTPTLIDIPVIGMKQTTTKVFVMFGEPSVVADAIRSLQ